MQYILSEEEYKDLLDGHGKYVKVDKKKLQDLCTLAAKHIPVNRHYDKDDKSPWGCEVFSEMDEFWEEQMCDHCPCVKICPYENKEFSK